MATRHGGDNILTTKEVEINIIYIETNISSLS